MSTLPWLILVLAALAVGLVGGKALASRDASAPAGQFDALGDVLDVIPDASVLVDASDQVLAASSNSASMGLISGGRLKPVELRALNREAARLNQTLSKECVIQRNGSAISQWEARLQVSPVADGVSLVIAQDLSESRRLNDIRRDFVANVSHELKTPVGALSLLAEAIQAADNDVAQVRKFAERMQLEVHRLTDLVTDLVELSRVQGETHLKNSTAVSVRDIVMESVDSMKIAAQQKDIDVAVSDLSDAGLVFGDERQLVTALRNLVSNAINYSPANTRVGVGVKVVDGMVEVAVTDQGPGIAEADQGRIFERFYRVDPARSRETGGTGLGLAIVKHICANHGGECTVWSRVGEGSTFTLHLPAYRGATDLGVSGK